MMIPAPIAHRVSVMQRTLKAGAAAYVATFVEDPPMTRAELISKLEWVKAEISTVISEALFHNPYSRFKSAVHAERQRVGEAAN